MEPCVISGNLMGDAARWGKFFKQRKNSWVCCAFLVRIYDCSAKRARQLPRFAAIWISIVYNLIVIWAAIPFPSPMFCNKYVITFWSTRGSILSPWPLMIWNGLGAANRKAWCKRNAAIYIKPLTILSAVSRLLFHKVSFQMVSIAFGVDRFPSWKLPAVI